MQVYTIFLRRYLTEIVALLHEKKAILEILSVVAAKRPGRPWVHGHQPGGLFSR